MHPLLSLTSFHHTLSVFWNTLVYEVAGLIVTEAMEAVAPGLCLGALSKVPIEIYKFLIEVPFAKDKSPCPFKYEVSGLRWFSTCKLSLSSSFVFLKC